MKMRILFYAPPKGHDLYNQAYQAYNAVKDCVKECSWNNDVSLDFSEMDFAETGKSCRPSDDVIACVSYGDKVTEKIADRERCFAGIPVFALTGTVPKSGTNIFPLLPSPQTSGFLLARGIANIVKHERPSEKRHDRKKILFICLKVTDLEDSERKKSFETTIKAHCVCDFEFLAYKSDEAQRVVCNVKEKKPDVVAVFGYGNGLTELVSGILQNCPQTIVLCDFNFSEKDLDSCSSSNSCGSDVKHNIDNGRLSCLCLKKCREGELVSGKEVFTELVKEVLKSISEGIVEGNGVTETRKNLLEWIPEIKYFQSSFGNFLFRGDHVLCYPIWQHTSNRDKIIDTDRDNVRPGLAEIVSDKLNRAGRKVEDWKSGKIKSEKELLKGLGMILSADPFYVEKFVFGCCNPIPSQEEPYIFYCSPDVKNEESSFKFFFEDWFSKLVMRSKQTEGDVQPLQINLHGEDVVDNGTWRLYGIVGHESPTADRWWHIPLWSVICGKDKTIYKGKLSAICVGMSENRTVNSIKLIGKRPDVNIQRVWEVYDSLHAGDFVDGANGVAYLFPYDGGDAIDFSARCIIWVSSKLMAYEIKILSNILNMAFSAIADKRAQRKIIESSLKSAIGSIMSRNGSHNIGSHVLAALSHNVGTMPDDQMLYQYIQHRMDYIATATTERPSWCQSTMFVGEMVKRFLSQRHLLNFICKSEGLRGYEFQSDTAKAKTMGGRIRLHVRKVSVKKAVESDGRARVELDEVVRDFIKYGDWHGTGCESKPIDLNGDVSLAIPGGIVGQHAFFTIIENIIRNSAKHDWSSPPQRTHNLKQQKDSDKIGDLDIFIDFEEKREHVEFFIWTRLSDVFAADVFAELSVTNKVGNNNNNYNSWFLSLSPNRVEQLLSSLQEEDVAVQQRETNSAIDLNTTDEHHENSEGVFKKRTKKIFEVMPGDWPFHNLEIPPKKDCVLNVSKDYGLEDEGSLQNAIKPQSKGNEGDLIRFDLLPLHQRQQVELETGFIDVKGNLRRENWGLAEMKISAGYLMKAELAKIGGLDRREYDWDKMLIRPCCMQDKNWMMGTADKICGAIKGNVWHLGYNFSVPKSKMILLLVDDKSEKWGGIAEKLSSVLDNGGGDIETLLAHSGIFIRKLSETSVQDELNYEYILLDEFQDDKREWMLPFRVIAARGRAKSFEDKVPLFQLFQMDDDTPRPKRVESVVDYLSIVIEGRASQPEKLADVIKRDICTCWVRHLQNQRGLKQLRLEVLVEASTDSKSGQSLITDEDVVEFAFNEGIFGALETYKLIAPESDREANKEFIEALMSLGKYAQDGAVVNKLVFDRQSEADKPRVEIIKRQLRDWAKLFADRHVGIVSEKFLCDESERVTNVEKLKRDLEELDSQLDRVEDEASEEYRKINDKCREIQNKIDEVSKGGNSHIAHLIGYLDSYCEQIKKLLSKYAEEIATLPAGFSKSSRAGGVKDLDWTEANVSKDAEKRIRYVRHGATINPHDIYLEALSGTQSYLSTLERTSRADYPLLSRLIENAILRVLIVDERSREFLDKHAAMEADFARMNIFVADDKKVDTELAILVASDGKDSVPSDSNAPVPLVTGVQDKCRVMLKSRTIFNARTGYIHDKSSTARLDAIKSAQKRYHDRYDIIVIHQGIIDKWLPGASHDKNKVASFLDALKQVFRFVVITTGRGTPANIPASGRVLPFSTIQTTLFRKYPEKMILIDAIMNILPVKAKKEQKQ